MFLNLKKGVSLSLESGKRQKSPAKPWSISVVQVSKFLLPTENQNLFPLTRLTKAIAIISHILVPILDGRKFLWVEFYG
jgi:hypothetical protein